MSSNSGSPSVLRSQRDSEACKIHHAFFGQDPQPILLDHYLRACQSLGEREAPEVRAQYARLVSRVHDLEALEIACRYLGKYPLLSMRFRIMLHLAETLPSTQPYLVNERCSRWQAWFSIFGGGIRSAWKLSKGLVLLVRYDNA
jgi:hypothetical protein